MVYKEVEKTGNEKVDTRTIFKIVLKRFTNIQFMEVESA